MTSIYKGRIKGCQNRHFYKYKVVTPTGEFKYHTTLREIRKEYTISGPMATQLVNYPGIVDNPPFTIERLAEKLPVHHKVWKHDEARYDAQPIIYDIKGNIVNKISI